jgi:hypothetical protein
MRRTTNDNFRFDVGQFLYVDDARIASTIVCGSQVDIPVCKKWIVIAVEHRATNLLTEDASIFVFGEKMFVQSVSQAVLSSMSTDLHDSLVAMRIFTGFEQDVDTVERDDGFVKRVVMDRERVCKVVESGAIVHGMFPSYRLTFTFNRSRQVTVHLKTPDFATRVQCLVRGSRFAAGGIVSGGCLSVTG